MTKRHAAAIAAGGAAVAIGLVVLLMAKPPTSTIVAPAPASAAWPWRLAESAQPQPALAENVPADAASASATSAPACPHQHLTVQHAGRDDHACVSDTRTLRSGSTRAYEVAAEGLSHWHLRVAIAAGRIVAAKAWTTEPGAPRREYACRGKACVGVAAGTPDADGARRLRLQDVALKAAHTAGTAASAPADSPIRLSADLRVQPERQNAAAACEAAALTVLRSDGVRVDFCASGGAGYEVAEDSRRAFVFDDADGRRLAVRTGLDGAVDQVTFGGYSCAGVDCGGVSVAVQGDPADADAERTFAFSGTTLRRGGADTSTLNGTVTMPAQTP